MSTFAKAVKRYVIDSSVTDEEFLNALLEPYVSAARVKGRGGADFHLDKSRTSKILSGAADVPKSLRKQLNQYGLEDRAAIKFELFVEERIDPDLLNDLQEEIVLLAANDNAIPIEAKERVASSKNDVIRLLAASTILAIKVSNIHNSEILLWKGSHAELYCRTGDILKLGFSNRKKTKNIVVIPVDNTFEVHVTRAYEGIAHHKVSENTLHGQWLTRMMQSGESEVELAKRINADLTQRGISPVDNDGHYQIGSMAVIEEKNAVYLLLAISSFDENGKAKSGIDDVRRSLQSVVSYYDEHGQAANLYIPLIGSGMSRSGLSAKNSFETICRTIVSYESDICGKIFVVVKPELKEELGIEL